MKEKKIRKSSGNSSMKKEARTEKEMKSSDRESVRELKAYRNYVSFLNN